MERFKVVIQKPTVSGANGVDSFNSRTGVVLPVSGDYTTGQVLEVTDKKYVTDAEKVVISNTSNTNTGDQDLSGLQPNQTVTDFTDAFTVADGTKNVTLTMTNAVNKDVTVKSTSFSNVGDRCVVSNLLGVGFPIIVPFDANIELVDTDDIANADFGRKGLERVNDVGGKVQIQLY